MIRPRSAVSSAVAKRASDAAETVESVLDRIGIGWVLFASFAVHAVLTIGFLYPTALFDEFIYLAYGRALSGIDAALVNLHDSASQHALYGVFLAPFFRLSQNFTDVYRAALVGNCLLATAASLAAYALGRELGLSRGRAVAITIAIACYPSFLLYPTFTASENLFIPLFAGTTWAGIKFLRAPSVGWAILFGAGAGALYATHSSGIVIALAAVAALVHAVAAKRISVAVAGASVAALAVTVSGAVALDRHILAILYGRSNDLSVDSALVAFAHPAVWLHALANGAGSVFAISVATFGLFPAGLAFAVERLRRDELAPVYVFVVLSALGCLVGASVFLAGSLGGSDSPNFLFAARYLEGVAIVPILLGFVALADPARWRRFLVTATAAIAISGLACLSVANHFEWFDGPGRRINMIAFASFLALLGHATLVTLLALELLIVAAIIVMRRSPLVVRCAVLAVAGLCAGVLERQHAFLPIQTIVTAGAATLPLADAVRARNTDELAYDMDAFDAFGYALVELQDPKIRLIRFSLAQTGVPHLPMVITHRAWQPRDYRLVMCESFADSCLWVRAPVSASFDYAYDLGGDVNAQGLYGVEGDATLRYRWTDGDARIRLVRSAAAKRGKHLAVVVFTFTDTPVEIRADGKTLYRGHVSGEYNGRFAVRAAPRAVEIKSATFVPVPVNGFTRRLGVELRELRLDP